MMNDGIKTYVVSILETCQKRKRKVALLHYELDHPAHTSETEMISAMALEYGDGSGGGHVDGRIPDKTLYITLNYRSKANTPDLIQRAHFRHSEVATRAYGVRVPRCDGPAAAEIGEHRFTREREQAQGSANTGQATGGIVPAAYCGSGGQECPVFDFYELMAG